ncbi:MAG: hypothetical protein WC712_01615 [Candidatus Brocadiia bacterium]
MMRFTGLFALAALALFLLPSAVAGANPTDTAELKEPDKAKSTPVVPIEDKKDYPWLNLKVSLGYQYDSNVVLLNKGLALVPRYETSKLVTTVTLRATPINTANWKVGLQYDLYNAEHNAVTYMEILSNSVMAFALWSDRPNFVYLPVSWNLYHVAKDPYLNTFKFSPIYYNEVAPRMLLSFNPSVETLDFTRAIDEPYCAEDYGMFIGYTYMFTQESWLNLRVGYEYVRASANYASYSSPSLRAATHFPIIWKMGMDLSISYFYKDFRGIDPVGLVNRVDSRWIAEMDIVKPLKYGISTFLRYYYIETNSNVAEYDYSRHVITLGLQWEY